MKGEKGLETGSIAQMSCSTLILTSWTRAFKRHFPNWSMYGISLRLESQFTGKRISFRIRFRQIYESLRRVASCGQRENNLRRGEVEFVGGWLLVNLLGFFNVIESEPHSEGNSIFPDIVLDCRNRTPG